MDPFGNIAAQQGGFLMSLGNHIGVAVPGEPLQVSAAIWHSGGDINEVHPVKVRWKLDAYSCRLKQEDNQVFDFGQTVQAPSISSASALPVVNAVVTLPAVQCTYPNARLFLYVCTTVADGPSSTEACGSYNAFDLVPALPMGAECGPVCGDGSGAPGTTVSRADPVSTATGAFYETFTDARVPAPGVPLSVSRAYSSADTATGALGQGWRLPWETRLEIGADSAVLVGEGGARHTYTKSGTTFTAPSQARSTLAVDGSGYKLTTTDSHVYSFNSVGRLTSVKDRGGRGLVLEYTDGLPTKITDAVGRAATLAYAGPRLDTVTLSDGRIIDYGYSNDRLSSVKALDGAIETYGYDGSGRLDKVTNAAGRAVAANVYDVQGRVASQTDADNRTTTFAYSKNGEFDQTDTTAPDGGVWTDVYYKNVLFTQIDPFGNKSYYGYDQYFNRTSEIDAEGRKTSREYSTSGRRQLTYRYNSASNERWSYNDDGTVASHTDAKYNTTTFGYTDGLLTSVRDPLGKTSTLAYNATTGLLETATTARGRTTRYGYDALGDLTSLTTPTGAKTTYTHHPSGQVKTVTDPRGNAAGADPAQYTTTFTYDAADRVKSVTDPRGNTTAYDYDVLGLLTKVTDAKSRVASYDYDAMDRLIKVTDPAGKTTLTTYDAMSRTATVTDRTGATTSYGYDKAGRQTTMVTARGNAAGATKADFTWQMGYDKVGNRKTVTDPKGKTTAFTWDADNRPLATIDPLNHKRRVDYDANGRTTQTYDALGRGTTLAYDEAGRLAKSTTWSGNVTRYEYDDDGNLTAQVSPEGERTTYVFDDDGRRTSMVDPRGNISGADPLTYTWQFGYDIAGHATSVTDPLGHTRTIGYDSAGNAAWAKDARGKQTLYEYDELNRPSEVINPDGGVTLTGYNLAGQPETSTDANSRVTTYGYDAEGRVTSLKNPLGKTVSYGYDPEGNRTTVTNARGQKITTNVDARNLPTQVAYSDGTPTVTYTHDDAGRITTVTDATGSRTATYNDDNRVTRITAPGTTGSFQYDWNTDGTLNTRAYPDGRRTYYTYDADSRIKAQRTDEKTTGYTYDAAGNTTSVTLPTTTARTETRTYDPAGRLATLTTPATGTRTFGYDENNRLTSDAPATGYPVRYGYDDAGRITRTCTDTSATSCLTGTDGTSYTYDRVGNLTTTKAPSGTTTHAYDVADRRTASTTGSTTTPFTYDDDGNQTGDGNETYTYDPVGRIKTAKIAADTYAFGYDSDGNRTTTSKNGTLTGTSRWDINNPLPQLATDTNAAGALLGDYQYDPDGTARSMDRTTGKYYFTQDRQHSVSTVYDAAGTDNYRYTYDSWGKTTGTATVTGGQTSPFGYTGQYKDQTLPDRLQLRARSYDPAQQRFTTTDPVPAPLASPNHSAYNYADNDPLNLSDPSGACPMCIGAGIGAVFGGGLYALTHEGEWNWRDFAIATGKGAVIGAGAAFLAPAGTTVATTLGLTGGRAFAGELLTNAGVGAAYTWAINTAQCQPTTPADLLLGAAGGAGGSLLGPAWNRVKGLFRPKPSRIGPGAAHSSDPAVRGSRAKPDAYDWGGSVRYGGLDHLGRPTGVYAQISKAMLNTGTAAGKLWPPGWHGNGTLFNEGRGHLYADRLGGAGKGPLGRRNLVTQTQNPTNTPQQRDLVEGVVYDAVDAGEIVQYNVTPIYGGTNRIPIQINFTAIGNKGFIHSFVLDNPASGVRTAG
ncbi:DUF6531 domain-containing protein [Streptomyces sp. NPDC048340]|uniref:DUF6531 domain-containing protein n=1 Tax=Streptomyces sp. NPDC048340 TaxID=3365537 RepID=UPI003714AF69